MDSPILIKTKSVYYPLSWQNILYPHALFGDLCKFANLARAIEYPFYCWNGRIIDTSTGRYVGYFVDKGEFIRDDSWHNTVSKQHSNHE